MGSFKGGFQRALKEAGVLFASDGKKRVPYSLRHTYATMRLAMLTEQHEQPAIAKAAAGVGEFAQLDAQFGIRRPARLVADHLAVGADDRAGPPF